MFRSEKREISGKLPIQPALTDLVNSETILNLLPLPEHNGIDKEIRQGKCMPGITTTADYEAAAQRGYESALAYLAQLLPAFPAWTPDELATVHFFYLGGIYPHAGLFRQPGELAAFGGRVGADAPYIHAELSLLMTQARELFHALPTEPEPFPAAHLRLISFIHARLVFIHPFQDGNGRWARLITAALEMYFLPRLPLAQAPPKQFYINCLQSLPANLTPLMAYHAARLGLYPPSLEPEPPPAPVFVTQRGDTEGESS
jgi:fido (protein-threonine AMPylation protein)